MKTGGAGGFWFRTLAAGLAAAASLAGTPVAAQTGAGAGERTMPLTVRAPDGAGLDNGDEWVLNFIQIVMERNFARFAGPPVLTILSVPEEPGDTEEDAGGTPPPLAPVPVVIEGDAQVLLGKLTRNQSHYLLDFSISSPVTGRKAAAWLRDNVNAGEILDGSVLWEAFADLAAQLGAEVSGEGLGAGEIRGIAALAKGNAAGRRGSPVETLNFMYNAVSFDPTLMEAASSINFLTSRLLDGDEWDEGSAIRDDKTARDGWKGLLDEFEAFYFDHPPFEAVYVPEPAQRGATDYDAGTAVMEFALDFRPSQSFASMQKVLTALTLGLRRTKSLEKWGLANWPYRAAVFTSPRTYTITAELINNRDEVVAITAVLVSSRIFVSRNRLYADASGRRKVSFPPINIDNAMTADMMVRVSAIDAYTTEEAQMEGFVRITPAKTLPPRKAASLLAALTRDVFGQRE